jgi:FAD/FMN-containing dehydrogenase
MDVAELQAKVDFDRLVKPWFDVWLPESQVENYVVDVVGALAPDDVGEHGSVFLFPQKRLKMKHPFLPLPGPDGHDRVYLLDILTVSEQPGPDTSFAGRMLARNRRLFDAARAVGGTRYPIGAQDFDRSDWFEHYGAMWPELVRRKERYDPDNILTPGPGIFP